MKFDNGAFMPEFAHVTSYAEVWIEIDKITELENQLESPPTRRCGLKFVGKLEAFAGFVVTSYAEVWIEIGADEYMKKVRERHLLRGGVD